MKYMYESKGRNWTNMNQILVETWNSNGTKENREFMINLGQVLMFIFLVSLYKIYLTHNTSQYYSLLLNQPHSSQNQHFGNFTT